LATRAPLDHAPQPYVAPSRLGTLAALVRGDGLMCRSHHSGPETISMHDLVTPLDSHLPRLSVDLARAARRSDSLPSGWDDATITRALLRYRRFLHLVSLAPETPIAPTADIDFMWHLHMLSPRAYHADCMRLFGDVLDHDGGFGREPDERPILGACFERTAARWREAFGEPYVAVPGEGATSCWHDCSGRCWHACKSVSLQALEAVA